VDRDRACGVDRSGCGTDERKTHGGWLRLAANRPWLERPMITAKRLFDPACPSPHEPPPRRQRPNAFSTSFHSGWWVGLTARGRRETVDFRMARRPVHKNDRSRPKNDSTACCVGDQAAKTK
jgi:hypothetical protein